MKWRSRRTQVVLLPPIENFSSCSATEWVAAFGSSHIPRNLIYFDIFLLIVKEGGVFFFLIKKKDFMSLFVLGCMFIWFVM